MVVILIVVLGYSMTGISSAGIDLAEASETVIQMQSRREIIGLACHQNKATVAETVWRSAPNDTVRTKLLLVLSRVCMGEGAGHGEDRGIAQVTD